MLNGKLGLHEILTEHRSQKRNGRAPFDLCAFDLDGTLLNRELEIAASSVEALRRLRGLGVRLVVATGRRFETACEHAERLGFLGENPVICYGGSMVRRMDGETLLHHTLERGLSVEILRWAEGRGLQARLLTDGGILLPPRQQASLEELRSRNEPGVRIVGDLVEWVQNTEETPTRIVVVDRPDLVEEWLPEAQNAFAGRAFVTRSLPHYVEIGSLSGTKSWALSFLCEKWGIDPSRVAAFGDADNDADMLRFAGLGVSVGGATEGIRSAADEIAPPVEEDGVARFLETLLDDPDRERLA